MKTEKIKELERSLGVTFPAAYVKFLNDRGFAIIDGFKVAGIPADNLLKEDRDAMDVEKTTNLLRWARPDLPENLVVIIFIQNTAVCLDLSQRPTEDAPMVEVDLESNKPPMLTDKTFSQWLEHHTKWEKRFRQAWNRITNRQIEAEGKNRIQGMTAT